MKLQEVMSNFLSEIKKRNPLKTRRSKKKFWRIFLISLGYFVLGLVFLTAFAFAWFSKDLPTPTKIANAKPTESTKIYDRTGTTLLYETGEEKRTIVQSDQISQYLKDATISTEDANFYKHHGVDVLEIVKAVGSRLIGRSARLRGASTITQQFVKNSLLTPDRSFVRKIKEAILAVELEFMFNKDQILTMYLNEIPYGNANGGAEAAAKMYFGKSAKDLDIAESATLAAIPQAPTYYSPYGTHADALIGRRDYVLDQMLKYGKITQAETDLAKAEDTTTVGKDLKARTETILAPHFAMYVLEQVAGQYGEDVVQKQGLKIITTLDYDKQKMAQDAISTGVPKLTKYGASNGALVAVDPKTGQILAMVGSKDYFDNSIDGQVNVADSPRQPGSSFKPIAYATLFKQPDFSPSRILYDFETDFGGGYIPHNYNGKSNGPVTMRQALSNSLNVPAVKVMSLAGIDNVLRTASDFGITSLTQRDRYGLSLVLGAGEVRPVEMAGAFSVFATGGTKNDVTPILKITDTSNKVLYDFDKDHKTGQQVLDPQIAYEISNILSDNNSRSLVFGTRTSLYFPDRTVAVKTGTTSDFKDAWSVGYTPSLAVAVWTGNSDGTKMKSGADGSVVAAPIFHNFIDLALAKTPNEDFAKPDGIQTVTVERYSNKLPSTYSTQTTTDIFATWQVPTDQDTSHKVVKLCKGTNLLAPDNAPESMIETKVFADVHSERPDNPNWENPVRAWAIANGLVSSDIPTAYCDINAIAGSITINAPTNGAKVSGTTLVTVAAVSPAGITKVEYYIDDVLIGTSTASPFDLSYNFSAVADGSHTLKAISTDSSGITAQASVAITVSDSSGPVISNISSAPSSSGGSATTVITWTTNKASTGVVNFAQTGGSSGQANDANSSLTHSVTLNGLPFGKNYTFTITAKDSDNNSSTSTSQSFTTPLHDEAIPSGTPKPKIQ